MISHFSFVFSWSSSTAEGIFAQLEALLEWKAWNTPTTLVTFQTYYCKMLHKGRPLKTNWKLYLKQKEDPWVLLGSFWSYHRMLVFWHLHQLLDCLGVQSKEQVHNSHNPSRLEDGIAAEPLIPSRRAGGKGFGCKYYLPSSSPRENQHPFIFKSSYL